MIQRVRTKIGVVQNLGWLDRVVRFGLGALLVAIPVFILVANPATPTWTYYVILISVYPFLTGIIGWDPVYEGFQVKSCDTSERNQCGSFPFEVDAALGNKPIPDSDIDHSLEHSHHYKKSRTVGT